MGEKHFLYGSAPQWRGFNFTPQWDCAEEGPPKSTSSSSVLQSCSPSYPASQRKALHLGLLHTTRTPHYAFCTTNMVKIPTLKPWLVLCPSNARVLCSSTWLSQVFTCLYHTKRQMDTSRNAAQHQDGGTAQAFHSPSVTSGIAAVSPLLLSVLITDTLNIWTPSTGVSFQSMFMWCLFGSCCACACSELPLELLYSPLSPAVTQLLSLALGPWMGKWELRTFQNFLCCFWWPTAPKKIHGGQEAQPGLLAAFCAKVPMPKRTQWTCLGWALPHSVRAWGSAQGLGGFAGKSVTVKQTSVFWSHIQHQAMESWENCGALCSYQNGHVHKLHLQAPLKLRVNI